MPNSLGHWVRRRRELGSLDARDLHLQVEVIFLFAEYHLLSGFYARFRKVIPGIPRFRLSERILK